MVNSIDLELDAGESIAIVGESGSGKSLIAKSIPRLLPKGFRPTGEVRFKGRDLSNASLAGVAALRGSSIGMVFQDPFTMLNPVRTCGNHISELLRDPNGRSLDKGAARAESVRRLAEVGIHDPGVVDRYPSELSGGMRQRVGIAAALARDPELLIADEPTTALDVTTQREILRLLKALQQSRGMGLILITHDLRVAFATCSRVYVLYGGALLETSPAAAVESAPLHPYTLGLMLSEPPMDRRLAVLETMPGHVPAAVEGLSRCQFAPRCSWATDRCATERPDMVQVEPGRRSACLRIEEIRDALVEEKVRGLKSVAGVGAECGGETVLRVRGAAKTFTARGHGEDVAALRDVSIEVRAGESVGIVGESGSGKTTLARCVMGLEHLDAGEIHSGDVAIDASQGRPPRSDVMRLRQTMQMVFQDPYSSLNPVFTLGATLSEALRVAGRPASEEEARALLEQVGLPASYAGRKPKALSGGERQRVAIARALAMQPKTLVCDEPLSALDVSVQAQIMTLFRDLQTRLGTAFLFITHDLAVVRQVADRIYVMSKGEVVESGPTSTVLDSPTHPYTQKLISSVPSADPGWLSATVSSPRAAGMAHRGTSIDWAAKAGATSFGATQRAGT